MKKVYNFLGGRKIFFALLLTAIISIALFTGYANINDWKNFMKWVFGIYVAGNGTEHIAKRIEKKREQKEEKQ